MYSAKKRKLTAWKLEGVYSAQKKKVNGPEGSKYFFPVERGKLSHYYRENLIYKSRAVNFLFLRTVYQYNVGKKMSHHYWENSYA